MYIKGGGTKPAQLFLRSNNRSHGEDQRQVSETPWGRLGHDKSKSCSTWQHHPGWQPLRDIGTFLIPSIASVQGQQDGASDRQLRYRVFYGNAFASAKNNTVDCCCPSLCEPIWGWGGVASLCQRQITLLFLLLSASLCFLFSRFSEDLSKGPRGDLQVMGCWLLQWMTLELELIFCATT